MAKLLRKIFHIFTVTLLVMFAVLQIGLCSPLPRVNEQHFPMVKIPQYHCLRYFKHDLLMMRRCRHLHVPMAPRQGEAKKFDYKAHYEHAIAPQMPMHRLIKA